MAVGQILRPLPGVMAGAKMKDGPLAWSEIGLALNPDYSGNQGFALCGVIRSRVANRI